MRMVRSMLESFGVTLRGAKREAAPAPACVPSPAPAPDERTPIRDAGYVVIDTELTGLNEKKDSIVSLGAIRMRGGVIEFGHTLYRIVNPAAALTAESVVIHQITPSEVQEKPDIDTVLAEFLRFCGGDIVVGHCVSIDLGFINRELRRISGSCLKNRALDTYVIFEWLGQRASGERAFEKPSTKDYQLHELARRFDIPVSRAHNAMMDAFITAQVFQRFIPVLLESGVHTVGELLSIGNPFKGGDAYRAVGQGCNL